MSSRFIIFPVTVLTFALVINLSNFGTHEEVIAPEVIAAGGSYSQDDLAFQAPMRLARGELTF